jgi:hypothetical protein
LSWPVAGSPFGCAAASADSSIATAYVVLTKEFKFL